MIEINTLWGTEVIEHTKVCIKCGIEKPLNEFGTRTRDKYGVKVEHRNDCKECQKTSGKVVSSLKKDYPYPSDENYKCPICERTQDEFKDKFSGKIFVLDHDHETNSYRGYICQYCNTGLSRFSDDVETLKRAILYLSK